VGQSPTCSPPGMRKCDSALMRKYVTIPLKCTLLVGIWTPSNTWFLGLKSQPSNDISIGSAIFAQPTRVPNIQTDRQTQTMLRATSVGTDHIYALLAG